MNNSQDQPEEIERKEEPHCGVPPQHEQQPHCVVSPTHGDSTKDPEGGQQQVESEASGDGSPGPSQAYIKAPAHLLAQTPRKSADATELGRPQSSGNNSQGPGHPKVPRVPIYLPPIRPPPPHHPPEWHHPPPGYPDKRSPQGHPPPPLGYQSYPQSPVYPPPPGYQSYPQSPVYPHPGYPQNQGYLPPAQNQGYLPPAPPVQMVIMNMEQQPRRGSTGTECATFLKACCGGLCACCVIGVILELIFTSSVTSAKVE